MENIDYDAELFVPDHIRTYTGKYFNAFDPLPELICIEDIAHALSQQPRYAGHLPQFYSVAQHSIYVARILPKPLRLCGLLHDAAEAYLCDIPSPYKKHIPGYKDAEWNLLEVILKKFGIYNTYWQNENIIKAADIRALKIEWDVLMQGRPNYDSKFFGGGPIVSQHGFIESRFLIRFKQYSA
jgi:Predicted hydrolases of HD superfamily